MSTRDNASEKKVVQGMNPASVTTTQTPADGAGIDTKGYEAVTLILNVGAVADLAASPQGDGSWTFKVQEADSDVNASYTDITDSNRLVTAGGKSPMTTPNSSTGVFLTLNDPDHQNSAYHVGVISPKRYVRMIATAVSTPGASLLSYSAVLERGMTPVSN